VKLLKNTVSTVNYLFDLLPLIYPLLKVFLCLVHTPFQRFQVLEKRVHEPSPVAAFYALLESLWCSQRQASCQPTFFTGLLRRRRLRRNAQGLQ